MSAAGERVEGAFPEMRSRFPDPKKVHADLMEESP
jgi:hypothetical protein